MALNYLYMFEFVVDDLLITMMNECAPEEYPTYVEMSFRSQCYVSICDQEEGGCMEATCRNGKCALFALDEELVENDTLFVHVYKRRPGKKCKFLLGMASVPVYTLFKKVTRHFHEENPLLVEYFGINLDEEDENGEGGGKKDGRKSVSGNGEKRKSQSGNGEKRKSTDQERSKGGQDRKKAGQDDAPAESEEPKQEEEKPEPRKSAKPRPCPVREAPPPEPGKYKNVCQAMAEEAQAAKDKEREQWEAECRERYEKKEDGDKTEEEKASSEKDNQKENQNGGNGDGHTEGECPKEPNYVAGCMTEMFPRQEEYCPTAEISKKLLSLLHCNGKQTGNIVLIIRLSCMGPCIVSPFIFGKNSLCEPPLCAPDCEPPATRPCDKKKGSTKYPDCPNPAERQSKSNTFTTSYHKDERATGGAERATGCAERATGCAERAAGGGGGRVTGGGERATGGGGRATGGGGLERPPSCCPSSPKKCCKPKPVVVPVHRYFNCDPCAGCPFAERPCDAPNCSNIRQRSGQDDECEKIEPFDPCACYDKTKKKKKGGKKGKREKGGMDVPLEDPDNFEEIFKADVERLRGGMDWSTEDYEILPECDCDECNEMMQMRLSGGGGCSACNPSAVPKKCKCPDPEPEPYVPPPPPICPPLREANKVIRATKEEQAYDEFEANLNGTGITIRVLKNSHTVTDVIDSEDSGCEMSDVCGKKKKSKNACPDDVLNNPTSKRLLQSRTGGKIENGCNIPLVKGTMKYSENERCVGDCFELPASSVRPCDAKVSKVSKYRKTPEDVRNCCIQVAGENIDKLMSCVNRGPKAGIEVCHKKCVDENSDVFVLRLGKKQYRNNKKKLIELELKTPKEPIICPIQYTTVFTHVNEKILDAELGKKGKRGKGKKKK